MTPRTFWILVTVVLATVVLPLRVAAQGPLAGRVQESIEITDRRIELAERLVQETTSAQAASELAVAKQLQSRARSAFGTSQYGLAERSTLEARNHADRAIAILRGLPDPDRVQVQVERTAELADRARERLGDCSEVRAKSLLRVGLEMQARAEAAVRESRHLAALQLTMSARERLFKAMRLCNVAEGLGEQAQRALQRTEDLLARAREALEDGGSDEVQGALERATAMQAEARSEYRAEHFESALRLTHTARLMAKGAMQRARAPAAGSGSRGHR